MADSTDPAELYSVLWQGGRRPDLDAFLASAGPLTPRQLADLVCTDQRERWRAGDRVPVESYFQHYPQLRADPALARDLLYAEVLLRGASDPTSAADLSRRFPDLAAALRVQVDQYRDQAAPPTATNDRPLPPRFGRYEIQRPLGRGGMGTVYLARDTQLHRLVALKVPMLDGDPGRVRLFLREAQAAAALRHPHICPVYDAGEIDGRPFLTMAYLDGEPLSARVARGALPVAEAVRLVRTMAEALEEAHRAGIIHRDLKPSNIMLDGQGQPVITDFGLARNLATGPDSRSGQAMVGTPNYMAPEQVNGTAGSGGPPVDVYALGVVLYELLTGSRPFDGPLGTVLARITTDDPEPPSRRRPDVDARLSAICLKALAKDPAGRFPSMAAFAAALDEWLTRGAEPVPARRLRPAVIGLGAAAILLVVGLLAWRPWVEKIPAGGPPPDSPGPPPALGRDPAGAEARAELAWRINDDGELDRAIEESTAALAIDDRCVSALLCRANARLKKGEARLALPDLTRAAELDPTNHEPEIDLAWALNELDRHDEALKHADRAVRLRPDSAEAYCQRGGAYKRLEKYPEAVKDLTEAIRLKADFETAYRERAEAYAELGEDELARRDEKKADDLARRGPKR